MLSTWVGVEKPAVGRQGVQTSQQSVLRGRESVPGEETGCRDCRLPDRIQACRKHLRAPHRKLPLLRKERLLLGLRGVRGGWGLQRKNQKLQEVIRSQTLQDLPSLQNLQNVPRFQNLHSAPLHQILRNVPLLQNRRRGLLVRSHLREILLGRLVEHL